MARADREAVLRGVNARFDETGDDDAVIAALGSPTFAAVSVLRGYTPPEDSDGEDSYYEEEEYQYAEPASDSGEAEADSLAEPVEEAPDTAEEAASDVEAPQEAPAGDFLRLLLNAFHFLQKGTKPLFLLKPVVEMRMLSFAGYMPNLVACSECGRYLADPMYFYPARGELACPDCAPRLGGAPMALPPGVLTALRHTVYADFEKLFSFTLPEAGLHALAAASERYVLCTLDRGFQTLIFFHGLAPR